MLSVSVSALCSCVYQTCAGSALYKARLTLLAFGQGYASQTLLCTWIYLLLPWVIRGFLLVNLTSSKLFFSIFAFYSLFLSNASFNSFCNDVVHLFFSKKVFESTCVFIGKMLHLPFISDRESANSVLLFILHWFSSGISMQHSDFS